MRLQKIATVSHILVDDEATAAMLKQQLAEGADFANLAIVNSTCPSSVNPIQMRTGK